MIGKDKCEFLKGIRKRMAEANGIPYEPRECTYEGDCTGTCPFCEKEAAELMTALKKKKAEGAEIKTDDVGILAIELGINECQSSDEGEEDDIVLTGAEGTLIEHEKNMVEEQPPGSLMNSYDEDTNIPELPIDPFRGSNNPLMVNKDLEAMRRLIHEQKEPLMGDINDEEWRKPKKEEWRLQQEEIRRVMEEQETPLEGYVLPYEKMSEEEKEALLLMEEMEERERGTRGRVLNDATGAGE